MKDCPLKLKMKYVPGGVVANLSLCAVLAFARLAAEASLTLPAISRLLVVLVERFSTDCTGSQKHSDSTTVGSRARLVVVFCMYAQ